MSLFQKPVALSPSREMIMRSGIGGLCIPAESLNIEDIIVSTTKQPISTIIRLGTASVVSHATLYAGGGFVIEAIENGVTKRAVAQVMEESALTVAYRSPDVTSSIAKRIV